MLKKKLRRKILVKGGFFLLLLLFLITAFFLQKFLKTEILTAASIAVEQQALPSFVQDQGTVEVHFCPQEDCETLLVSFLDQAQSSLHCAFYDLGLPSVQKLLLRKKEEGKEVQIVTDDAYLKRFNYPFVKADGTYGLMHNKFCIVDGNKVSTGSMNPTQGDAHENNNNLLFISSSHIAQNYEDEFAEMWQGTFKGGKKVATPGILLKGGPLQGGSELQTYFCPEDNCAEKVKEEIRKAKKTIYFLTFSFTHEGIAQELLFKKMEGIEISGIMDQQQAKGKFSVFPLLQYQGLSVVQESRKGLLHHKVFIIDGERVITGSFNPTESGDQRNDENLLIIKDQEIAKQFTEEFDRLRTAESGGDIKEESHESYIGEEI